MALSNSRSRRLRPPIRSTAPTPRRRACASVGQFGIVYRLSGTGTAGATLRLYRALCAGSSNWARNAKRARDLIFSFRSLAGIEQHSGRKAQRRHLKTQRAENRNQPACGFRAAVAASKFRRSAQDRFRRRFLQGAAPANVIIARSPPARLFNLVVVNRSPRSRARTPRDSSGSRRIFFTNGPRLSYVAAKATIGRAVAEASEPF